MALTRAQRAELKTLMGQIAEDEQETARLVELAARQRAAVAQLIEAADGDMDMTYGEAKERLRKRGAEAPG